MISGRKINEFDYIRTSCFEALEFEENRHSLLDILKQSHTSTLLVRRPETQKSKASYKGIETLNDLSKGHGMTKPANFEQEPPEPTLCPLQEDSYDLLKELFQQILNFCYQQDDFLNAYDLLIAGSLYFNIGNNFSFMDSNDNNKSFKNSKTADKDKKSYPRNQMSNAKVNATESTVQIDNRSLNNISLSNGNSMLNDNDVDYDYDDIVEFLSSTIKHHRIYNKIEFWRHVLFERISSVMVSRLDSVNNSEVVAANSELLEKQIDEYILSPAEIVEEAFFVLQLMHSMQINYERVYIFISSLLQDYGLGLEKFLELRNYSRSLWSSIDETDINLFTNSADRVYLKSFPKDNMPEKSKNTVKSSSPDIVPIDIDYFAPSNISKQNSDSLSIHEMPLEQVDKNDEEIAPIKYNSDTDSVDENYFAIQSSTVDSAVDFNSCDVLRVNEPDDVSVALSSTNVSSNMHQSPNTANSYTNTSTFHDTDEFISSTKQNLDSMANSSKNDSHTVLAEVAKPKKRSWFSWGKWD